MVAAVAFFHLAELRRILHRPEPARQLVVILVRLDVIDDVTLVAVDFQAAICGFRANFDVGVDADGQVCMSLAFHAARVADKIEMLAAGRGDDLARNLLGLDDVHQLFALRHIVDIDEDRLRRQHTAVTVELARLGQCEVSAILQLLRTLLAIELHITAKQSIHHITPNCANRVFASCIYQPLSR